MQKKKLEDILGGGGGEGAYVCEHYSILKGGGAQSFQWRANAPLLY